jgi:hypothetical protein
MLNALFSLWLVGTESLAMTPDGAARLEQVHQVLETTNMGESLSVQLSHLRVARQSLSLALAEEPTNEEALALGVEVEARIAALQPNMDVLVAQEVVRSVEANLTRVASMMTSNGAQSLLVTRLLDDCRRQLVKLDGVPQYDLVAIDLWYRVGVFQAALQNRDLPTSGTDVVDAT